MAKQEKSTKTSKKADDIDEGRALRLFKQKCQAALLNIPKIDDFRAEDTMVDYVFKVGRELFEKPLDTMTAPTLIRTGGRLTGVYSYIGQKSAQARGQRDVYKQKAIEVEKEIFIEKTTVEELKVTEARARVEIEMAELNDLVIKMEVAKTQWENMTEAVDKMISFIQSAIKVKEGERFASGRLQNNQG